MVVFLGMQTGKSIRSGVSAVACHKIALAMRNDLVMGIVHKIGGLRFLAV